jgi:hypothetical protein
VPSQSNDHGLFATVPNLLMPIGRGLSFERERARHSQSDDFQMQTTAVQPATIDFRAKTLT